MEWLTKRRRLRRHKLVEKKSDAVAAQNSLIKLYLNGHITGEEKMSNTLKTMIIALAGTAVLASPSIAADKVRLVNSTKVVFETEHPYTALEEGIFKKRNLDVSVIHGSGGAASLQAVLTGS